VNPHDVVLDPELAFEHAQHHWKQSQKCRKAGMEWARLQDLCTKGRELVRTWDRVEAIYETAEAA
jgi:hypothetical protein